MRVLGIHDGHNSSAALLEDGKITHCIQEERLTNTKNFWDFPEKSVRKILEMAGLKPSDIDHVAVASLHAPRPSDIIEDYKKCASSVTNTVNSILMKTPLYQYYRKKRKEERLADITGMGFKKSSIAFMDHHMCHAAAAYYGAPWRDEKVLVFTSDGSGDGLCGSVCVGENGKLKRIAETPKGNSIGNVYSNVTFMLGLTPWEHEWKIMGMAPYAYEKDKMRSYEIFRQYLSTDKDGLSMLRHIPEGTNYIYSRLRRDFEFHRFDWISAGVQELTEELLTEWVREAARKTGIRKVCLSGGVFMNVKANKRIMELDEVDDIFPFPSAGDESNSIGAAYYLYAEKSGSPARPLDNIYLGPDFTDEEALKALEGKPFKHARFDDIEKETARLLSEGKIVARCKGRMEFGARALGNRSILADPSNQDCVRVINMMIKKRDFWMPFAPVVLKERQHEYIGNPKNVASPYMMLSFDSTEKRGEYMAGVHQADLTARAQILEKSQNPDYYRVLKEFEAKTGRGVLLNTSFNLHGYPMVNTPAEAVWVFENSGLEYLALGNLMVTKK